MKDRWRFWPFTRGGRVAPVAHCEPPVVFGEDWSVAAEAIASQVGNSQPGRVASGLDCPCRFCSAERERLPR